MTIPLDCAQSYLGWIFDENRVHTDIATHAGPRRIYVSPELYLAYSAGLFIMTRDVPAPPVAAPEEESLAFKSARVVKKADLHGWDYRVSF